MARGLTARNMEAKNLPVRSFAQRRQHELLVFLCFSLLYFFLAEARAARMTRASVLSPMPDDDDDESDDEFEGDEDDDASADGFVTIGKNNAPKPGRKPSVDADGFVTVGKKSAKLFVSARSASISPCSVNRRRMFIM